MQAPLLGDSKAVVILGLATLQANVLRHHLIGHVTAAADEETTSPQVAPPELRPQPTIVAQEMVRAFPLDRLHDAARREMGWDTDQQMDMVRPNVPLKDLRILGLADLPDQFSASRSDLALQYRLPVLCCKDEMIVQPVYGVRALPVFFCHGGRDCTGSPLKASPKGEGFPLPRMGQ